ncbi:MAG TPA: lysophospholipid acyltransferase family protein [Longimicrobiales bacterium]
MQFWLRMIGACVLFGLGVLWGGLVWLATRSVRRVRRAVSAVMAGPVCRILRFSVRVQGGERLEGLGAFVLIANHQSLACHMVLAHLYRRVHDMIVVGKLVGKWNIPVVVQLFRLTGNIIVDPGRHFRSGRALLQGVAALRAGTSVALYPEGTRRKDTRQLGPFHRGAFVLAIDAGVPLVPVVVSRFKPRMDVDARRLLPQTVRIRVLQPIATSGMTRDDTDRLRDLAAQRMQAVLDADEAERAAGGALVQESPPRRAASGG